MADSNYTIPDEFIPTQCINIKIAMEFSNVQQPSIFDKLSFEHVPKLLKVLSEETPTKIEISKSISSSSHDNAKTANLSFDLTASESGEISDHLKREMPEPQKSENVGALKNDKHELQGHEKFEAAKEDENAVKCESGLLSNVTKSQKYEMAKISKHGKPVPLKRGMGANASNGSETSNNKSNGNEKEIEFQKLEKPERVKRILGELPKRVMLQLPENKKPEFPQLVMGDNEANDIESILNEACVSEISTDNEEDATIVSKKKISQIPSNGMGLLSNVMKIELPKSGNLERTSTCKHVMPEPQKNEKDELQKYENVKFPTQKELSEQLNVQ